MLRIRVLNPEDISFADHVRSLAGWNQTLADWNRFLAYEPEGCFLAEWDGQPCGTVTTTSYGTDLAWIGMMLVHPDFRRRGIATALMETALNYLRGRGVRCIKLDATPDGQPVYERLGFRPEWEFQRWKLTAPAATAKVEERAGEIVNLELYDAPVFGADRSAWVERLRADSRVVIASRNAYGMIRSGVRADYLGPCTAMDQMEGATLIRRLLPHLNRDTFWDVPGPNAVALEIAREAGFEPVRSLMRMDLGDSVPGVPKLQFALGDPATG